MTTHRWPDRLTVTVTADDIRNGVESDCRECPVALATRRALGITTNDRYRVFAGMECIQVTVTHCEADDDIWEPVAEWLTPVEARDFMEIFDAKLWVEPFTFTAQRQDTHA